jgi:Family of unknown function (DUF6510)
MSDMTLDGNAAGGILSELFVPDMTIAELICSACNAQSELGAVPSYGGSMGAVLRCAHCDNVLLRLTHTPVGLWLEMSGTRRLFVAQAA